MQPLRLIKGSLRKCVGEPCVLEAGRVGDGLCNHVIIAAVCGESVVSDSRDRVRRSGARTPFGQHPQKIGHINVQVLIEICL